LRDRGAIADKLKNKSAESRTRWPTSAPRSGLRWPTPCSSQRWPPRSPRQPRHRTAL